MSQLVINDNISIYDLALQTGYTLDYVYKLIQENSILQNVDTAPPKLNTINYNNSFVPKVINKLTIDKSKAVSNYATLTKFDNDTIFDLVLKSYGVMDDVYKLIQQNNLTNVNDVVVNGKIITFTISEISDYSVYKQLKKYFKY